MKTLVSCTLPRHALSIALLSICSLASASTITTDQNASSISDISTAELIFGATDLTLSVTDDVSSVGISSGASGFVSNIDIAEGKTFTITSAGTSAKPVVGFSSSTLNVTGSGSLNFSATGERFLRGNINFYTDVSMGGGFSATGSVINFYGDTSVKGNYSGQANTTVNFKSGSNTVLTHNYASWGANSFTTVESGASLTAQNLRIINTADNFDKVSQSMNIAGSVTINGLLNTKAWNGTVGDDVSVFASMLNIEKGGSLVVKNDDSSKISNTVIVTSMVNDGYVDVSKKLYLSGMSFLTLKEGSTLLTDGATEQKYSYIDIAGVAYSANGRPVVLDIDKSDVSTAYVTVIIEGAQELGGFSFYKDSALTLDFAEGASLHIGEFTSIGGYQGDFVVDLTGSWGVNNLRIDGPSRDYIADIIWRHSGTDMIEGVDFEIVEIAAEDGGGFWLNPIVPEPASIAALFGAMALAFAVWRKRRA